MVEITALYLIKHIKKLPTNNKRMLQQQNSEADFEVYEHVYIHFFRYEHIHLVFF